MHQATEWLHLAIAAEGLLSGLEVPGDNRSLAARVEAATLVLQDRAAEAKDTEEQAEALRQFIRKHWNTAWVCTLFTELERGGQMRLKAWLERPAPE